ncbi:MAG: endonuclease/exonuclease/phosphatase family protein [Actinomycetota bacterium]
MRAATPGNADPRAATARIVFLAAATGLALQCLRALFPLVYGIYERGGVAPAAEVSAAVFAAPLLGLILPRGRAGTWPAVVAAVAGRIAIQVAHPAPLWLVALAAAWAMLAVTRGLDLAGPALAVGIALGIALDTATLTAFLTWDPVFRDGAIALTAAVVWSTAAVWGAAHAGGGTGTMPRGTWALGPALSIGVLFLANPAAVASRASLGPAAAAAVTLAGCAIALGAAALGAAALETGRLILVTGAAVVVTIGPAVLSPATGEASIALLIVIQGAWGLSLAAIAADAPPCPVRSRSVATAAGTLIFGAVLFAYQLDVERPLPVPRWIVPAAAGLLLGVAAARATARGTGVPAALPGRRPMWWVASPAATVLVIPLCIAASAPMLTPRPPAATIRVLDWNVHGSVDADGRVDPATIADAIAAQHPDVVVLQEVPRGWPIHGEIDLAAWLSWRLAMPYRWAPSADGQFGNLVLSGLDIVGSEALELPYDGGPQRRSALRVTLDVGDGRTLSVIGVHLQRRAGSDVGEVQATELMQRWGPVGATVLAGDLNAQPGDAATGPLLRAGLVSAQDTAGDPQTSTARDPLFPGDRVDWLFTSPDLSIASFEIVASDASDHLPLVTTVALR